MNITPEFVIGYIGPGAGIALAGSFLAVLIAMATALLGLITWPVRWMLRRWRGRRARHRRKVRRVVVLGLDGLDPLLVDEYLAQGLLPNLSRLKEQGTYARLGTSWPPLSPVAWSSFSTGTNPGKHNIFDFIARDPHTYGPQISSVRIRQPTRHLRCFGLQIPLGRPRWEALRKSKPFWNVLGEAGIFSAILRVPITFPPDRFYGVQLSAMCVPDIRGTQGTFTFLSENGVTNNNGNSSSAAGDLAGEQVEVCRRGETVTGYLPGPSNPLREDCDQVYLPLHITRDRRGRILVQVAGQKIQLEEGRFTGWQRLPFRLAPGVRVWGICRFYLRRFAPFELYATAVQIDPGKPLMPISHPKVYSIYLANQQGRFATLGLAEDTWSLSEGLMSEEAFLEAAYDIDRERQQMFFDTLRRVRQGVVACVFDAPDRIQHMFWRFHEQSHPARGSDPARIEANRHVIRDMYVRMDELVGKTLASLDHDTALIVMSDHGFKPFRRGVDLNAWLRDHGYLKLNGGVQVSKRRYLADVDWSQTRAYAVGLAGIFLNLRGRESHGIVSPGAESQQLVRELCEGLINLRDSENGHDAVAIREAVPREKVYHGPYVEGAPDIIVGYNVGYRVSWDAAVGKCGPVVFSDNTKAWSGDHCIHPALVPGVLFANRKLNSDDARIIDIGPTVLDLLGVDTPAYMDGKSLVCNDANSSTS